KLGLAAFSAEVIRLAFELTGPDSFGGIDLHSADNIALHCRLIVLLQTANPESRIPNPGQFTTRSMMSKTSVEFGGMLPTICAPYPRFGGMTRRRCPPTFMPTTP